MSSTCSVLPRDLVSVEVAAEQVGARPQTLLTRSTFPVRYPVRAPERDPQMANPRPTPKPENLRPPWPPGTSGNPAGYSRGRRISDAIERLIEEMALRLRGQTEFQVKLETRSDPKALQGPRGTEHRRDRFPHGEDHQVVQSATGQVDATLPVGRPLSCWQDLRREDDHRRSCDESCRCRRRAPVLDRRGAFSAQGVTGAHEVLGFGILRGT